MTQEIVTIDLRDFIEEIETDGVKVTRKEALNSLKELEKCGLMKIIKRNDKNRYTVELLYLNKNKLLPGFKEFKL